MPDNRLGLVAKLSGYALVIILLLAFAGVASYAVLSDNSVHGLTVRFYNVSWAYSCNTANPSLVYTFGSIVVYSSNSLPTSLTKVLFLVSTNGVGIGNVTAAGSSFGAGQSSSYDSIQISSSSLNPTSLPVSSTIGLTIDAQASAGLYTAQVSASYSQIVHFPTLSC